MCSIVGSFKKEKLIELCKLNVHRGQTSHSISYFDIVTGEISVIRGEGPINYDHINFEPLTYCIVHMQAPTQQETKTIHPAYYDGRFLWHNGILKQTYVDSLKSELNEVCNWDTFLMLKSLVETDKKSLNNFDGSFACLLYDNEKLYAFRNEIAPLYYDANMNISSTSFSGSKALNPNSIYHMDFNFQTFFKIKNFTTVMNPYFFAE
jgi:glutamine phosphoribosylpyrophosphate amidotransferase